MQFEAPERLSVESGEGGEEEEKRLVNPEIEALRHPMQQLLEQLKDYIDAGEYRLLVGDDASGRIPTLLFDRILKTLARERKQEPPVTIFLAGAAPMEVSEPSRKEAHQREAVRRTLMRLQKKNKMSPHVKALVVTDTIGSGETLLPFTEILQENAIEYDIATIGLTRPDEKNDVEAKLGGLIYYGQPGETPQIYKKPMLSGVRVDKRSSHPHAQPVREDKYLSKFEKRSLPSKIASARKDVATLSAELLAWYRSLPVSGTH